MAVAPAYDYLLKLLLAGDAKTGKTCLLIRFTEDVFHSIYISTIGIDFKVRTIEVDEKRVKLQIWDTDGQERFREISQAYYRGAMGAIFVYDITNEDSFKVVDQMLSVFKEENPHAVGMVVGNKCDLENARAVSSEQGQSFAGERGCLFIETSAKDDVNVEKMVVDLVEAILSRREGGE